MKAIEDHLMETGGLWIDHHTILLCVFETIHRLIDGQMSEKNLTRATYSHSAWLPFLDVKL